MAMTFKLPNGECVAISSLKPLDEVGLSVTNAHATTISITIPFPTARQFVRSILSITDPEDEVPVKQAPDWRCGSCRSTQDECRSSPGMKSCCTGCENTDGRIHGC